MSKNTVILNIYASKAIRRTVRFLSSFKREFKKIAYLMENPDYVSF